MSDPTPPRLVIPRLTSRSGWWWSAGTLLAVLAMSAYFFLTQPQNRWAVLVVVPVAALLVAFVLLRRTWVETGTGVVVRVTLLGTRKVSLGEADKLELANNRGGALLLRVRQRGRRGSVYLPVLLLTDYVRRSQSPAVLEALAEQLETWAPRRRPVAGQLRRQADHLRTGGSAEDSPLAALVSHGVISAAKAGGAAGGSSLLD